MQVDRLTLTQFRNLEDTALVLSPGVNVLVGENGQGKTNVLEAIYLFKFGRSFRTARDTEMIRFSEPFFRIESQVKFHPGDDGDVGAQERFACTVERGGEKTIKTNGEPLPRLIELVGKYPAVLFGPSDLRIVSGQPDDRRRFIDMVGSMSDRSYIDALRDYRRALKQRNAALKSRAGKATRAPWDQQLVETGVAFIDKRSELVETLGAYVKLHGEQLGTRYDFRASYESTIANEAAAVMNADTGGMSLADVFAAKLESLEHEELRRGTTLAGPHRDDVKFSIDGNDLRKYGSQGQRRLLAILLKMAELSHLETSLREPSLLLLDDVFSEFDASIMARLQHLLDGERQVFITTPVELDWAPARHASVFKVDAGVLTQR